MSNTGPYLVQCISGDPSHVMEVIPDTELEAMCIAREAKRLIDALCLGCDECPSCVRERNSQESAYLSDFGCPMADADGECEDDCPCMAPFPVSPYEGQVRGLSIHK